MAGVTSRGDRQAKKPRAAKAAPAVAETAAVPAAVETPPVETPPVETPTGAVLDHAPEQTSRVWHDDGEPALDDSDLLVVSGPPNGRWRAGRYFNREAATIRVGDLTDGELSGILGDPMLSATLVAGEHSDD